MLFTVRIPESEALSSTPLQCDSSPTPALSFQSDVSAVEICTKDVHRLLSYVAQRVRLIMAFCTLIAHTLTPNGQEQTDIHS